MVLELTMTGPDNQTVTFAASASKLALENDIVVSYPTFAIGAAAIAACLILTLYGMVMTMKRVKLIKKKKLKLWEGKDEKNKKKALFNSLIIFSLGNVKINDFVINLLFLLLFNNFS